MEDNSHTDSQKKQNNFIQSKPIAQITEGHIIKAEGERTLKAPDGSGTLPWGSRGGGAWMLRDVKQTVL